MYDELMPELPEVQTTVNGLRKRVIGRRIKAVWSSYNSPYFHGDDNIKDPTYFKTFQKAILGQKIVSVDRRAKNILINLSRGQTILVHMKMTGHLLYGTYRFNPAMTKDPWEPLSPLGLRDPFNRHVRLVFTLDNGHHLALSDMRKFAKVTLLQTETALQSSHLQGLGPEPLDPSFTFEKFRAQLADRPHGKIKLVLMDQTVLSGIGNIYADESLWRAGIHPLSRVAKIPITKQKLLYQAIRKILSAGIDLGGSSTSDYRNIDGEKGTSQEKHHAYRRTGEPCDRRDCSGHLKRITVGSRGTHFCDRHQKLFV